MFIDGAKIINCGDALVLSKGDVVLKVSTITAILDYYDRKRLYGDEPDAPLTLQGLIIKRKYSDKYLGYSINDVLFHKTDLGVAEHLIKLGLRDSDFTFLYKDKYKMCYYKYNNTLVVIEDSISDSRYAEFPVDKLLKLGIQEAPKGYDFTNTEYIDIGVDSCGNALKLQPLTLCGKQKVTHLTGCCLGMGFIKKSYTELLNALR